MSQINNVGPSMGQIEPRNEPVQQDVQRPVQQAKPQVVDARLLGVTEKLSDGALEELSFSPSTVEKLASRKLEEFDEGVKTQRKLKTQILEAKVAAGQMSKEGMQAELQKLETGWKTERDRLAGKCTLQYETAKANRDNLLAKFLGKVDRSSLSSADKECKLKNAIEAFEGIDKKLAARYVKEKPLLNADGTKSTVWTRLTSKKGAITAGTLVTGVALGLLGTLGAPVLGATLSIGAVWGAVYCGIGALFGVGAIIAPSATKSAAAIYEGVKENVKGNLHVQKDYEDAVPEESSALKSWMDERKADAVNQPVNNVRQPQPQQPVQQQQPVQRAPGAGKVDDDAEKHRQALARRKKELSDELLKEDADMQKVAKLENMVRALTVLVAADNVLADNNANVRQIQQGMNDAMKM